MDEFVVDAPVKQIITGSSPLLNIGRGVALTITGAGGAATVTVLDLGIPEPIVDCGEEPTEVTFRKLVAAWKAEMRRSPTSSVQKMWSSEHYQRVIGIGRPAVPLLLAEIQASPDHWDWALEMITGEDPVPPEAAGKLTAIVQAWVDWGRARQLV